MTVYGRANSYGIENLLPMSLKYLFTQHDKYLVSDYLFEISKASERSNIEC